MSSMEYLSKEKVWYICILSMKKCILVHLIMEDSSQGGYLLNNALNLLGLSLLRPTRARVFWDTTIYLMSPLNLINSRRKNRFDLLVDRSLQFLHQ